MFLPGEILSARADKKSAEAVVALKPGESQEEQRAEASRKKRSPDLVMGGAQVFEMARCDNCGRCQASRTGRSKWILAPKRPTDTKPTMTANRDARSASMK